MDPWYKFSLVFFLIPTKFYDPVRKLILLHLKPKYHFVYLFFKVHIILVFSTYSYILFWIYYYGKEQRCSQLHRKKIKDNKSKIEVKYTTKLTLLFCNYFLRQSLIVINLGQVSNTKEFYLNLIPRAKEFSPKVS